MQNAVPHSESVLFSAGHGFYKFAVPQAAVDRSLYYNLLLQPALAIPDHYFLQGTWLGDHLGGYPARDSWVEAGLRNGFIKPYFREESRNLSELLSLMEGADRRGFNGHAKDVAERVDRTPFTASHWSSADNSASFGDALRRYLSEDTAPVLELRVDPDDFVGFWGRSRDWIDRELEVASERSSTVLGSEGILLSQLIQVSGERLLGSDCGRIRNIDELLSRVRTEVGVTAERDLRAYYSCACELYNRSLADTIITVPNSPRWNHYVAAMDLWRDHILIDANSEGGAGPSAEEFDVEIRLPRVHHLQRVSGDVLVAIRNSPACRRYFESLTYWQLAPTSGARRAELVDTLRRYSEEIRKQVGNDVGGLGLRPQFMSKVSDVSDAIEKVPDLVQGFLAVGTYTTAVSDLSPLVPAGLFSLFCLQMVAKHHSPSESVDVEISGRRGVRLYPDVTISRA